jgi:hypothetical protein
MAMGKARRRNHRPQDPPSRAGPGRRRPLTAKATITESTQGEIWVADQGGWSPFVVRAQLLQTTTTQVEGGPSGTETVYIEEDVTGINSSGIVIEPPE